MQVPLLYNPLLFTVDSALLASRPACPYPPLGTRHWFNSQVSREALGIFILSLSLSLSLCLYLSLSLSLSLINDMLLIKSVERHVGSPDMDEVMLWRFVYRHKYSDIGCLNFASLLLVFAPRLHQLTSMRPPSHADIFHWPTNIYVVWTAPSCCLLLLTCCVTL